MKLPQAGLDLSSAARGGLTIFLAGVARQVAASNVTINNLLPGAFETDRLKTVLGEVAKRKGVSYEDAKAERIASIPAKRLGDLDGFGATCAFLCSAQAGFITGQNLTDRRRRVSGRVLKFKLSTATSHSAQQSCTNEVNPGPGPGVS